MADSTTILDLIAQSQSSKEITANALFDVASPAMFGGRRASACSGLTWGYYGGQIIAGTGVRVTVPNGTITLTASATNTIYLNRSGTIGVRVGPPQAADEMDVLYSVDTGSSTVTSYLDLRRTHIPRWASPQSSLDISSGDWTVSGTQQRVGYLTITGALTVNRNLIVPNYWDGMIFNNTTNAYTVTVKTSAGTGIVVGQGKRCILLADGTNVVRITADV
jgi:hypothetical protein